MELWSLKEQASLPHSGFSRSLKKISTNVGNVGHSVTAKSFKAVKVV